MSIKAIETVYAGYRFRSRLEARWAVFFDTLNIHYEYEPQGYDLGEHGRYLPDFWLPQVKMWAEVKSRPFTTVEKAKCKALAKGTGYPCLMLDGPPATRNYWAFTGNVDSEDYPGEMDYVLSDSKRYWENEGRFFSSTGIGLFEINYFDYLEDCPGILAARQARFEHGETPSTIKQSPQVIQGKYTSWLYRLKEHLKDNESPQ